jgi:hypothetical protein
LLQQATNSFTASDQFIAELVNLACWDEDSCASDDKADTGAVTNAVGFVVAATVALLAF